jgi:predicted phosphodiesterase
MDPDRPIRTALINSARELVRHLGAVGAILVSGDIAYKGDPIEYEHARGWLEQLATAVGCDYKNIFTVPGNHDCDRRTIVAKPEISDIQNAIRNADQRWRSKELWNRLLKDNTRDALIASLEAYNNFAARYGCNVYPPERLFWVTSFPLEFGFELHLRGITSTLLSGPTDKLSSLFVSTLQTAFDPVPGILHGAMLHHPPEWLLEGDSDEVEDALRDRTVVHFLGHKHRNRIQQVDTHVRFSAGAVNPEREEPGWQPGFNLIRINTVHRDQRYLLRIESHVQDWQQNPDRFRSRIAPTSQNYFEHYIDITAKKPNNGAQAAENAIAPATELPAPIKDAGVRLPETAMKESDTRDLVFRFWNLRASQRREITLALGLISAADLELPESERYRRAFDKARTLELVKELEARVTKMEVENK